MAKEKNETKTKFNVVPCSQCGRNVELTKHVNKCVCGARIKVLEY